jgi:hypothetical protein
MIVDLVLQRDRAARLVQFASSGGGGTRRTTLGSVIDELVRGTWRQPAPTGATAAKLAAVQRVAQRAVADRLLTLAADSEASPEVRAMAELKITELRPLAASRANVGAGRSDAERAHWLAVAGDFTRWLERREVPKPTVPLVAPPGDPFGEP